MPHCCHSTAVLHPSTGSIHGDEQTGITTFWLDHQIDTGRIICQETLPIGPDDCAGDIHDRMMVQGLALVCRTADMIADGEAEAVPQEQFLTDEPLRPLPRFSRRPARYAGMN